VRGSPGWGFYTASHEVGMSDDPRTARLAGAVGGPKHEEPCRLIAGGAPASVNVGRT
jgi:hypothetical protein